MPTNLSVSCFSPLLLILIQQRASKWSQKFFIKTTVFTGINSVYTAVFRIYKNSAGNFELFFESRQLLLGEYL